MYLEDLSTYLPLSQKAKTIAQNLATECDKLRCQYTPSVAYMEKLVSLTVHVVASIASGGTSILVFVPGMNEIISIMDDLEQLYVLGGLRFSCIPVHSDIPFEDQLTVFSQTQSDECRVIVATNSAESSVTLPALDHVIDLGLCRQIVYNPASHRQLLTSAWISRASATQRKGRTGRIAKGTVYRLFTKSCYEKNMEPFEPGEMLRIPLDSVILMLKGILKESESVSQVLLEFLEPPNAWTIDRSFQSLTASRYITRPDDEADITSLGSFVSSLGIDLSLGSLIGLGIQFGVGVESIWLAGVLSFPTMPWIKSNPLIHGSKEFNEMAAKTVCSRFHFNKGLHSEPFAMINLVWEYNNAEASKKAKWCWENGVNEPRLRRLASACFNLQRKVADLLGISPDNLEVEAPCSEMPESKLTILRAIQVWVFHDTMIQWTTKKKSPRSESNEYVLAVDKKSDIIKSDHVASILNPESHPFSVRHVSSIKQTGAFSPVDNFWGVFEQRLLSYSVEKGFLFVCYYEKGTCVALVHDSLLSNADTSLTSQIESRFDFDAVLQLRGVSGKLRGVAERACGKWLVEDAKVSNTPESPKFVRCRAENLNSKAAKSLDFDLNASLRAFPDMKYMSLHITLDGERSTYALQVSNDSAVSMRDLQDLLQSLNTLQESRAKETLYRQEIVFPIHDKGLTASCSKPLIPDGARILLSLAAAARRSRLIKLLPLIEEEEGEENPQEDDGDFLSMYLESIGDWTRLASGSVVYLPDLSHIAYSIPLDYSPVFCVCANSLEIRGGALKVEGLTILPDGKVFALLCQLAFGLEKSPEENPQLLVDLGPNGGALPEDQIEDVLQRCFTAQHLNDSLLDLGEELVCDPANVVMLLEIFDGLNGKPLKPWKNLHQNPFIPSVLKKSRRLLHIPHRSNSYGPPITPLASRNKAPSNKQSIDADPKPSPTIPGNGLKRISLSADFRYLFSTSLESGQTVSQFDLPSTNIMALLFRSMSNGRANLLQNDLSAWSLLPIESSGKVFYQARFDDSFSTGTSRINAEAHKRPKTLQETTKCIPNSVHGSVIGHVLENPEGIFFDSIESAVKLEASFWLEHHFGSGGQRWFHVTFDQMLARLTRN